MNRVMRTLDHNEAIIIAHPIGMIFFIGYRTIEMIADALA